MKRHTLIVWGFALLPFATPLSAQSGSMADRSVYIEQIGDSNEARVTQSGAAARTDLHQAGNRNRIVVTQDGSGSIKSRQSGDSNLAILAQAGSGQNAITLSQNGSFNAAAVRQNNGGIAGNAAQLLQDGQRNQLDLTQNGGGNVANLAQQGDQNQLTAIQSGGQQLTILQQGSGLSFQLDQGHPSLSITQVN
jgi:hypothetical protein